MKIILMVILSSSLAFGAEMKSQSDLPSGVLGAQKLLVEQVGSSPWHSEEVTLRFTIKGEIGGAKITLLGGFPRSENHPSSISIRITKGAEFTDYKVEQGSEFAKKLAKRIYTQPKLKDDESYSPKEYNESRVKLLRQLLNGTYSWKDAPPF